MSNILGHMNDADYRLIEGMTKSELSWMAKSPLHYAKRKDLQKETEAMRTGTLLHMALLEPARFRDSYILEPEAMPNGEEINKRKKDHRAYLEEFKKENAHRTIVNASQMEALTGMLAQAASDPDIVELLKEGTPETVALWTRKEGIKCKGKADYFLKHPKYGRTVVEVKKTQDASPSGFSRQIYNLHYHMGAAWYLEGFCADTFIFIALEDKPPYATGVYIADSSLLDEGERLAQELLDKLQICNTEKRFPGYTKGVANIALPAWVAALRNEE